MVHLKTPQAIIEKIAYVMANPTAAGAVRYAEDWPGVVTRGKDLGKAVWTAKRPEVFFDPDNKRWPEQAMLCLTMPEGLGNHFSDPIALIKEESRRLQQQARQELEAKGRHFLGAERVLKISPYKRATSWEEIRDLDPTFAVGRGQPEARELAITALRAFRGAYRAALELWRGGDRTAAFPSGTWWMVTFHNAATADWG